MKVLICIVFACMVILAVQGFDDAQKAKLRALYTKCVADTGVDPKLIENGRLKQFSEDKKLKLYYKCMFENLKFINEDGTFNVEAMKAILPVEQKKGQENIVKDCAQSAKADTREDSIYKVVKCFIEHSDSRISF